MAGICIATNGKARRDAWSQSVARGALVVVARTALLRHGVVETWVTLAVCRNNDRDLCRASGNLFPRQSICPARDVVSWVVECIPVCAPSAGNEQALSSVDLGCGAAAGDCAIAETAVQIAGATNRA